MSFGDVEEVWNIVSVGKFSDFLDVKMLPAFTSVVQPYIRSIIIVGAEVWTRTKHPRASEAYVLHSNKVFLLVSVQMTNLGEYRYIYPKLRHRFPK